jgi:hypothetical protein
MVVVSGIFDVLASLLDPIVAGVWEGRLESQGSLSPQREADILLGYHHALFWDVVGAAWHLVIAGLLIFTIRRLRD